VTIDGVLCKDGVIPDSAYPNALLLDGSRAMTGDLNLGGKRLSLGPGLPFIDQWGGSAWWVRILHADGTRSGYLLVHLIRAVEWQSPGRLILDTLESRAAYAEIWFRMKNVGAGFIPLKVNYNTVMISPDTFLKIGADSDGVLPTADATYRGKMIMTEGAAGVRDKLYMCLKSDADTYSWVLIADGGA